MSDLHRKVGVSRWNGRDFILDQDCIAIEALVTIRVNDTIVANLLASPADLQDLAIGHCITEAKSGKIVVDVFDVSTDETGTHFLDISTSSDMSSLKSSERIITSSCGACDRDGILTLMHNIPSVDISPTNFSADAINAALIEMKRRQIGYSVTGGIHAAGLMDGEGNLIAVREDIGRHNAVDKIFGHAYRTGLNINQHALLLSGRCGWDIVAKSATMNCQLIASIGASSTLAIESARLSNITIFSFVRADKGVVIGKSNRLR
jgi:FdhD protein